MSTPIRLPEVIARQAGGDPEKLKELMERYSQAREASKSAIARHQEQANIACQAQSTAKELRQAVCPNGKLEPEQTWLPFAPMPTDMCRVSPFFPMARQELGNRPFIRDMVITSSAWGEIRYTGPKLSTYEEDALMALLATIDSDRNRHAEEVDGRRTYSYRGPVRPLLELMGLSSGAANYKRLRGSLELLMSAVVKLHVNRGKGNRGVTWTMDNLLSHAQGGEDASGELRVTVNPFFYEMYIAGTVTLIDVMQRNSLKSAVSKSLHRFIMSHRADKWEGHFLTLANTLNLDSTQPSFQLRRQIKGAIAELVKAGVLTGASGFSGRDVVSLRRSQRREMADQPARKGS